MSMLTTTASLRERQTENLKKMLCFNKPNTESFGTDTAVEDELIWKVLILDKKSTDIVSSVLRVNDLLEYGITMHAMINQRRTQLADVNAIYFIEPTIENIKTLIEDLKNDKYSKFYINFTSSLNRNLLEEFAKNVALIDKSHKIAQIYDQYLDFLVTEPNLFSLNLPKVYSILNNPQSTEDVINSKIDQIVSGLFDSVLSLGSIPVIRCMKNGPAELIANKLDSKLRDHLINLKRNSSSELKSDSKSVLVLLDRNIDLSTMFSHSWIYQCMVSDVFKLNKNTIEITEGEGENIKTKKFDIDPKDFFWNRNASLPFPDAVENVELELNNYTNDSKIITNKTGYSSIQEIDPNDQSNTKQIQEAIKLLPELTHRKNIIDTHMTILSNLIKELDSKKLDSFFEIEQNLNNLKLIQSQLLDLLKATSKFDNSLDKLRTFIIIYLNCDLPAQFFEECESILKKLDLNLSSLNYIKKFKDFNKLNTLSALSNLNTNNNNTSTENHLFSNLSSKLINLTDGSNKLTEGFGNLISGIKNLLPEKSNLPITNIAESIMLPNQANVNSLKITDDYLYFDPNILRGSHSKQPKRKNYNEAMIFIVGGGNYLEYSNLQDWCNDLNKVVHPNEAVGSAGASAGAGGSKFVCYGSTDIVTANDFLEECSELGNA